MTAVSKFLRFFAVPDEQNLVLAQAQALGRQVPLMYASLLINSLVLAGTYTNAPAILRLFVPLLLTLGCGARLLVWLRTRHRQITYAQARKLLTSSMWIAATLAIGFTSWALSLFPYGDAYQQSHVAFYMGITVIACIFSLMHVRAAATMVALCVVTPFTIFFGASGNPVFMAWALNLALVLGLLMMLLFSNYRDFSALVASRSEMECKQAETQRLLDENYHLANMDALTGALNRRSFDRELADALERAQADGRQIAVARLDLDCFKSVNDVFGRLTGDRVLVDVAHRINALRRPSTLVARLGSDNFALIMESFGGEEALQAFGDQLTAAMRPPFETPLGIVHLSASAGLASSKPGDTAETLYDRADYVTWVAKRKSRGQAIVFSDCNAHELAKVRRIEHALLTADLDQEIYILFQPQFDIALNTTTGYEVLARWRSPTLGEVSPAEFIPMAERMGIISKITQAVLRKALAAARRLPQHLRLSVNLSALDLSSTMAVEAITSLVQQAGKPCRVDFEITETAVMHDMVQANSALMMLLALGSRIALDDFGTGHSSLTHVQKLPLHRIKVDRSFVAEVTTDPASRAIIKTTVDLCRNLGISCVFEGIETEEQLDALLGLGGMVMQGYLFGKPMSEERVLEQLAGERQGRQTHHSRWLGAAS